VKRERKGGVKIWKDELDRNIEYKVGSYLRGASVVVIRWCESSDVAPGVGSSSCGVLLSRWDWRIVPIQMTLI
jgi:hypothetical protein